MIRLAIMTSAMLLSAAASTEPPRVHDIRALEWMSGNWLEENGNSWTEERWSMPRGGVMLGTSMNGNGEKVEGYEFLRIAADSDGALTYWGAPSGAFPVPFRVVSLSSSEVIFENPRHDFPTRIAYRRDGATMKATIS